MTNFGVNKPMTTVEPSLVSSDVKMVVVGIRVKGRQGGEGVYSDIYIYIHRADRRLGTHHAIHIP